MVVVALCSMTDECELIVDYDMVVGLGKCWFWIDKYVVLMLIYVVDMCVFSYKESWLAQQGKVTSLFLCLFMH